VIWALLFWLSLGDRPTLVVLGTAQDAGAPQAGCRRPCCEARHGNPARQRYATSVALIDEDARWIFDATPDFPRQLALLDAVHPTERSPGLAGIFLTHAHIGHYTGLMHLGREVMGARSVPVHAMPRMAAFLAENGPWRQLVDLDNIVIRRLQADKTVILNPGLEVTPVVVPHRDEFSETVGFLIRGPRATALYLPDIDKWSRWEKRIEDVLATVDHALVDATFFDGNELPGRDMAEIPHPFIVETMTRLETLPVAEKRKLIFIHMNHTNPALEPDSEASASIEAAGFRIARRGMRIDL